MILETAIEEPIRLQSIAIEDKAQSTDCRLRFFLVVDS